MLERKRVATTLELTYSFGSSLHENRGYAQGFKYMRRCAWNIFWIGAGDALAMILALLIAGGIRKLWMGEAMIPAWSLVVILVWWVVACGQRLLPGWGIGSVEELRRVITLLAGVYAGEAMALVLIKESEQVSRIVLFGAFLLSLILVPLTRVCLKRMLIRLGAWGVPTVIYADLRTAVGVIQSLQGQRSSGYLPIGVFTDEKQFEDRFIAGLPVLGPLDLATAKAPVAILATRGLTSERTISLLDGPLASYRHIIIQPDLFDVQSMWVRVSDLGGLPGLEKSLNLLDPMACWTKHIFEQFLVIFTAPIWGAICMILAALIWLEDRRNPFFLQERIGKNGKPFRTRKFRTMIPNAEQVLKHKLAENPALAKEWESNYKLRHDPRITRIGNFLRKTSLDELPQLINVLKGEMSLVGPRPLPSYHHLDLTTQVRNLRERVRPGLTGLWQVSGRSQAGTDGMEKWDAFYVRNWSVWLDIVILIRTAIVVSKGTGAY